MFDSSTNEGMQNDQKVVMSGRPRLPLLVGQQLYIERAYTLLHMSQARIAQELDISIPRVRRHLIGRSLYVKRSAVRPPERAQTLADAVQDYEDGEKVVDICAEHGINTSELYRELRRLNVPYRTKARGEAASAAQTPVHEEE